ncbi:DUF3094 family protein [Gilvimarinus agarilyticus]|uniref:DUF3094 family protein n=1 Tax=Gilvimarinus agarilyticus TaxID=679259 RepID=UPI0005A24D18|nr:DUF3094 family protein [Gilvimarinus agarilyticus]|tara:strand:- start:3191 stop:3370 length:180 start_codon:yes stop_codon:yes gene_type:complete
MPSKLSPEDQARVDRVINRGTYRTERGPFRIKTLFFGLILLLTVMSVLSYAIAWYHGVV